MSVSSMTGYGRGHAKSDGIHVEVGVSSVNRKQLDCVISMPRTLQTLESRVTGEVQNQLGRGRVTGEISVQSSGALKASRVKINQELARTYVKQLKATAKNLGLRDDISVNTLLRLPDVIEYEQIETDAETLWPIIERALKKALVELKKMRRSEGRLLAKDLQERLVKVHRYLGRIRKEAPKVAKRYRESLTIRLKSAGFDLAPNDERLVKELAFFAERSDITEEITRLESHCSQFSKLLKSKGMVGRSLDFLLQEMLREINTIGSKANNKGITEHVVEFKAELERMREQAQNIE